MPEAQTKMHWRNPTQDLRRIGGPASDTGIYPPVLCLVDYGVAIERRSCVTSFQGVRFQHVDVFRYEGRGLHRGNREYFHVESDKLTDYLVTIPLRGQIAIAQEGRHGNMGAGSFGLLSTAKPFVASVGNADDGDSFSALHVRISGPALRYRIPYVDECCGRRICLQPGSGAIMKAMCELALAEGGALSEAQAIQFGATLVDAVATAVAEAPEILSLPVHKSSTAQVRIWRQARAYIELHLTNLALDTELVARHCRVSKRYLQNTFAGFDDTVTACIREARLQRCQSDFKNPALRNRSISEVALHWGFNDLPYFCRAYKTRFGITPSKDRNAALREAGKLPVTAAR